MNALAETTNMSRQLFMEWHPVIMYNHHQTGPQGAVMFAPPFRDPANYNFHPLIITGLDVVGSAMHNRFVTEEKGGTVMRSGANYSTWWNGGLRTTVYFHNMIGLLTETIGNPTPMRMCRWCPTGSCAAATSRCRWSRSCGASVSPSTTRSRPTARARRGDARAGGPRGGGMAPNVMNAVANDRYMAELKKPENRDPRAYVLSAAQHDFPTATKFIRALQYSGIDVHRATGAFSANGKQFPAGSWVIKTDQAFRSHVLDMFEPQDHPNDFRYPGGPPIPPYDNAAGRSRTRWASSSTGSSTASTGRSRGSAASYKPPQVPSTGRTVLLASCSVTTSTTAL
jgi:hypothetical protein